MTRRARLAPLHVRLTLLYTAVITVFLIGAGTIYGVLTRDSINSYAAVEAVESAETLGATLADAIRLENQGALRARGEAVVAVIGSMYERDTRTVGADAVQRRALEFLASQQIGGGGYYFVVDSRGNLRHHPYEDVRRTADATTPIIARVLRQKNGFVRYFWQNPTDRIPRDKIAYITHFAPWDWYIVATDYAAGLLERVPIGTLHSLLNSYRQESVLAAIVRSRDGTLVSASEGWAGFVREVRSTDIWRDGALLESRSTTLRSGDVLAFAPLQGLGAEVAIVYDAQRLFDLTNRFTYILAFSLVAAVFAIAIASRIAGQLIARPVRLMNDRFRRRLTDGAGSLDRSGSDDIRTLVLQQLRALVRLDYERRGREAAEHEAMIAESVFRHTSEGIVVTDAEGRIIRVNPAYESISGYSAAELIGANPRIVKSGRHDAVFYAQMWNALETTGEWVGEVWNKRKGGEEYPQLLSIRAVHLGDREEVDSYVAVCHDISERKETEDRLQYLATHDELTGLPNRAYLANMIEYTLRQGRRSDSLIAVLFLDIDNFKDVNDSYGHDRGDQLLKWIARRLTLLLRSEDTVVRFGGDEFVILLPHIEDEEYASVVARKILAAVREPYIIEHQKIRPSVSIGIAIYPEAGRDPANLLRDADAAMYAAKRQGRNTYRFHNPGMNESAHRRLAMQGSVASAIDRGELSIVYQPILSLSDNRISGAEALVRWNRDGRTIAPGEFLPYLENSTMLTRLDLWVLDRVCADIVAHDKELGPNFRVSVNAGAYNLIQDDFVDRATEIVTRRGVDPGRIAIEVTETAAIRNFDRARATLRDLQSAGFKLYLDDFGEGHSSIRYLREFGVDSVKLDRGYLTNVHRSHSARSLVSGFTQLAHGMRLQAVIEGVETEEQLQFIRDAGCDYAQGFLIGRPRGLAATLLALRNLP
ncbi:MAG: EAL domain-containing protein [Spirochaetota bacterium]